MSRSTLKHHTIKDALLRDIRSGVLPVGALVPAERELVVRFGASRLTVRHALDRLEQAGFITRLRGKGTFVRANQPTPNHSEPGRSIIGWATAGMDQTTALVLRSGQEVARERNLHHLITDCDGHDPAFDLERIRLLIQLGVLGLIVCPFSTLTAIQFYQQVLASGLPLVFTDSRLAGVEADVVTTDNLEAACRGTEALIHSGCRRIAFCASHPDAWTSQERLAGCRKALWSKQLDLHPDLLRIGPLRRDFGAETARWLLAHHPSVDGWFFAHHVHAEGAIDVLRQRQAAGKPIPHVCSFDILDHSLTDRFSLISVRQPFAEIGRQAVRLLLTRIDERLTGAERAPWKHVTIPAEIALPLA